MRTAHIYIMSGRRSVLKALGSFVITSLLVLNCLNVLRKLGKRHRVTIMWVAGHERVGGSKGTDVLAKIGVEGPYTGPESFCEYGQSCGYGQCKIRMKIFLMPFMYGSLVS